MTFATAQPSQPVAVAEDSKLFRPARLTFGAYYPVIDRVPSRLLPDHLRYGGYPFIAIFHKETGNAVFPFVRWMGEKRPPRKGEFFISGANPSGYYAANDLTAEHAIGELCFAEKRTVTLYTFVHE